MTNNHGKNLGTIIRKQRIAIPFTLRKISSLSGVSQSHLGRIERGERFPSADILRKIAKPLGFEERELFTLAGYLSNEQPLATEGLRAIIIKGWTLMWLTHWHKSQSKCSALLSVYLVS